jgi:hypothetical protein
MFQMASRASTRKGRFVSNAARIRRSGPPDVSAKLEPWFLELCNDSKHWKSRRVQPKKRQPPPISQPWWPRTAGQMSVAVSRFLKDRLPKTAEILRDRTPEEAFNIDFNVATHSFLSLLIYHRSFAELESRERTGDPKAPRQIVSIKDVTNRWFHGQLPPGGIRTKTHAVHTLWMLIGLAAGLRELNSNELVYFFDEWCPCGEVHNQQVLQRLRSKLIKGLNLGETVPRPNAAQLSHRTDPE